MKISTHTHHFSFGSINIRIKWKKTAAAAAPSTTISSNAERKKKNTKKRKIDILNRKMRFFFELFLILLTSISKPKSTSLRVIITQKCLNWTNEKKKQWNVKISIKIYSSSNTKQKLCVLVGNHTHTQSFAAKYQSVHTGFQ